MVDPRAIRRAASRLEVAGSATAAQQRSVHATLPAEPAGQPGAFAAAPVGVAVSAQVGPGEQATSAPLAVRQGAPTAAAGLAAEKEAAHAHAAAAAAIAAAADPAVEQAAATAAAADSAAADAAAANAAAAAAAAAAAGPASDSAAAADSGAPVPVGEDALAPSAGHKVAMPGGPADAGDAELPPPCLRARQGPKQQQQEVLPQPPLSQGSAGEVQSSLTAALAKPGEAAAAGAAASPREQAAEVQRENPEVQAQPQAAGGLAVAARQEVRKGQSERPEGKQQQAQQQREGRVGRQPPRRDERSSRRTEEQLGGSRGSRSRSRGRSRRRCRSRSQTRTLDPGQQLERSRKHEGPPSHGREGAHASGRESRHGRHEHQHARSRRRGRDCQDVPGPGELKRSDRGHGDGRLGSSRGWDGEQRASGGSGRGSRPAEQLERPSPHIVPVAIRHGISARRGGEACLRSQRLMSFH